jgi:preprotein translocase subunit SecE
MAKEKTLTTAESPSRSGRSGGNPLVAELFQTGLYKPSQGRIVRQVTFVALVGFWAWACYELKDFLLTEWPRMQFALPLALLIAGGWICYRAVNYPRFADFLIAVQAEMNKVSWPSQQELVRSSIVVIFVIFLLATLMFGFDVIWMTVFKAIGVLKS